MFRAVRLVVDTGMHHKRWTREQARRELGAKFSLPRFHNVVLTGGDMPLKLLEQRVTAWIAEEKARG